MPLKSDMAFDQNPIPMDLRPLNVARTVAEEPRIVPATTTGRNVEGFFPNSARERGSPGSIAVYYPANVSEAGYVGLGYGNAPPAVATWCRQLAMPVGQVGLNSAAGVVYCPNLGGRVGVNAADQVNSDMAAGFGYSPYRVRGSGEDQVSFDLGSNRGSGSGADQASNDFTNGFDSSPNLHNRGSGNGVDPASDEGGDDSVSGKKVKLLCSFGGQIFPRPSDGMLRYVGGQTRIICVRRDLSFNELVQKMVDAYGQPVVIKYQLPDEDLDALVSVSCRDDLDNMMDEYEKLVDRSSDGSDKLRVFLFSASELDPTGMVRFGDLHDGGQRYFDAVNGFTDGVSCGIIRKESIASASSTQNSDFSGNEVVDSLGSGQVDVSGPPCTRVLSPTGYSSTSHDSASRHADASAIPFGIPAVMSGPPQTSSSQPEVELEKPVPLTVSQQKLGLDLQQLRVDIPPPSPYLQTYVDPRREVVNHAEYLQLPPQIEFPNPQLLRNTSSVYTQQQFRDNAVSVGPHQFIPAVHMTMNSPVGMRPTMVHPLMQPQQTRLERYPEESTFGTRVVQLPIDQSYNVYQAQVQPTVVGGGYGWHQVSPTEHVVFSERLVPHQQVMFPEKISSLEDCYWCQKVLPHAHSDTVVQDQRDSGASPVSDSNSFYHSLPLEENMRAQPMNRIVVSGPLGEGTFEHGTGAQPQVLGLMDHQIGTAQPEAIGLSQNLESQHEIHRINVQKTDNPDHPKILDPPSLMALAGDVQSPYCGLKGAIPQSGQENFVQQHFMPAQYPIKQEAFVNKPVYSDAPLFGEVSSQTADCLVQESPKEYPGKLPGIVPEEYIVDSCVSADHLRPIDGMMDTLQIRPPENFVSIAQSKEDIFNHKPQQVLGREVLLDTAFSKPKTVPDIIPVKPNEFPPYSPRDVPYVHNFSPSESYEMAQPPNMGNSAPYTQSKIGNHHLDSNEVRYGNPAFSNVESAFMTDRLPPVAEWKDGTSRLQPKMVPSEVEAVPSNFSTASSLSPSSRTGEVQDSSNSLFSNQDPWNLQQDTFSAPRPNKIPTKNEVFATKNPFFEKLLQNSGELNSEMGPDDVHQPLSNINQDFSSEHVQSTRGSAEELIKQELQAVAEGVADSVLLSVTTSSPDLSVYERNESTYEANQAREVANSNVEMQHKAKFEEIKAKLPEMANRGFQVSDGIGSLQIIKNSDLEELRELGSGTFGTVYHGKWRGTDVAIKRINDRCFTGKHSEQERMRDDFWNEAIKLADLHHPNVVAFYGVVLDGPGGSVATVTEFMVNGSLRNALQKNERNLDKRKRLVIALDVAFGMEYLHGKNIVHFDLKSDNLLVNLRDAHRPICKVGDLGLSKVKCQTLISGGVRGTLPWMAPELLNGSSSLVSEKVDVFSFGVVLWELLTGEEPYSDLHYGAIIGGIVSNTLRPPVPESCDPDWRSLMERCWSSEPPERPSFTEIANALRSMAAKIPAKGQIQHSAQPHVQK